MVSFTGSDVLTDWWSDNGSDVSCAGVMMMRHVMNMMEMTCIIGREVFFSEREKAICVREFGEREPEKVESILNTYIYIYIYIYYESDARYLIQSDESRVDCRSRCADDGGERRGTRTLFEQTTSDGEQWTPSML